MTFENTNQFKIGVVVTGIDEITTHGVKDTRKSRFSTRFVDGQYPQDIGFYLWGKNADMLERKHIRVGDRVIVYFTITGRPWKEFCTTTLQAWKIDLDPKYTHDIPQRTGEHFDAFSQDSIDDNNPF